MGTGRGILQALPIGGPPTHIGGQVVLILVLILFPPLFQLSHLFSLLCPFLLLLLCQSLPGSQEPPVREASWQWTEYSGHTNTFTFIVSL